jgi:allophanate hydrolase
MTAPPAAGSPDVRAALAAARRLDNPAFIRLLVPDPGVAPPMASTQGANGSVPGTASAIDGMPYAVKDNIDVAGVPTTGACPALTEPAVRNARVIDLLSAAGAVPIAKTNMDQFATGLVGTRSSCGRRLVVLQSSAGVHRQPSAPRAVRR